MTRITAYFYGSPNSAMDRTCHHIFEQVGGKPLGAGTMLAGAAAGERDVEYDVPETEVAPAKERLIAAGFRLVPTKAEKPPP
jgi:hypothetical protein